MAALAVRFAAVILVVSLVLMVCYPADAYRKPPFNGSIFGKRAGNYTKPEGTARTIFSLCELASEACTSWFPAPAATENK
ncbi:Hypothetical predicted protein [Cloeon dipterum]|uniref:SIFamide n=1 Tax=Cloeon dipterum TaxID=197152 RepID=A0A8S1CW18_9INSE|nr:Hypothetical predicted protein [Cloeon dipterum]